MSPAELPGTVHDSKIKRQERLKSRFRDRGGIFVPSEGNPLVDVLLARGVNGESPAKRRIPRKSAATPKPRAPAASKADARTKTLRTGTSKRSTRKSAATSNRNGGKENSAPATKKRRGTLKTPKLQKCRTDDDMDTTYAGPSRPPVAAQRRPFADQLADAINATKNSTAPDSISTSAMPRPAVISTPGAPPLGKSKKTLGERKAKGAVDLPPRYTEELEAADEAPVHGVKTIKPPLVLALERQQREKQGAQKRTVTKPLPHEQAVEPKVPRRPPLATKQTLPPAQRELEESDSDDSDVPLAKKHAERARLPCDAPATLSKGKEDEPLPPKKRRGAKTKALPAGDDASDEASSRTKLKLAPQAPPPTKSARVRVGPGGAGKARVLQEKSAPTNAPRKRKERTKAMIDAAKGENEHEHEPPRKRSRRVDPVVSRRRKEDEEITRSAREASRVMMDRPLPSPVKQPAAHRKPASKAKLPSRTGAVQAPRSRGLPLAVLRRIKINAQALPALDDIDDDDPIDFLR